MDQKELRKRVTQSVATETRDEIKSVWRKVSLGVILIFTVLIVPIMQRGLATRTEAPAEAVKKDVKKNVKIALTEDLEAKAEASARGFLEAQTISEKTAYVMDAPRVIPLMEDYYYYQDNPFETRSFKELVDNALHLANDRTFIMSTVVFDDGSEDMWVFEKDRQGAVKLQWEAAVKYSEKDWDTFLETKDTEGGVFRVLLEPLFEIDYDSFEPDDVEFYRMTDKENRGYFNREFTENDYVCFRVSVPGSANRVFGYLDKSSASFDSFVLVRRVSHLAAFPAMADLRFPENARGDQVHIADIQRFSWIEGIDM